MITLTYLRRKRGASLLSYGLIVGLISVVALTAVTSVGDNTDQLFGEVNTSLDEVVSGVSDGQEASSTPAGPAHTGCPGADIVESNYCLYATPGTYQFVPVDGTTQHRVIVVSGGGGGESGHWAGGGGGRFNTLANTTVTGFANVTVGAGGSGGTQKTNNNTDSTEGQASVFGGLGSGVAGHQTSQGGNQSTGGSGGGGACNGGSPPGGAGGSGGSNGGSCTYSGAAGQGTATFNAAVALFQNVTLTAGAGGAGGSSTHAGGGGGGGFLVDGSGPTADGGEQGFSAQGGQGYGGGGGAGGYDSSTSTSIRWAGGDGADGMVLIEW